MSEDPGDVAILEFLERREVTDKPPRIGSSRGFREQKVTRIDDRIDRQRQRALDQILELAHVPWKRVPHDLLQRLLGDAHIHETLAFPVLVEKEADELRDIVLAVAQ